MARTIAIVNQKGGVGKTTTAVNLSTLLAYSGRRVLVVDADAQGNATLDFGYDPDELDEKHATLAFALLGEKALQDIVLGDNPGIVPAGETLTLIDLPSQVAIKILRAPLATEYDFIIIDCAPTLTQTTVAALTAADELLIPTDMDRKSVRGLGRLFSTIEMVRERANPGLRVLGVLPTMYHAHYSHDQMMLAELKKGLEPEVKVLEPISSTTAFKKASLQDKALVDYDKRSRGVEQYYKLANYILGHG